MPSSLAWVVRSYSDSTARREFAAAVALSSPPLRMFPCVSVIVTFLASRPGTAIATRRLTPVTWPASRVAPGTRVSSTLAVVGFWLSVNSRSLGTASFTLALWTWSSLPMVRDSSPSMARVRFTRWVKSVAPQPCLSKISMPTVAPPPASRLLEARPSRAWSS